MKQAALDSTRGFTVFSGIVAASAWLQLVLEATAARFFFFFLVLPSPVNRQSPKKGYGKQITCIRSIQVEKNPNVGVIEGIWKKKIVKGIVGLVPAKSRRFHPFWQNWPEWPGIETNFFFGLGGGGEFRPKQNGIDNIAESISSKLQCPPLPWNFCGHLEKCKEFYQATKAILHSIFPL